MKKVLSFALVLLGLFLQSNALKVSVYYESLCPDSIAFLTNQLYPSYEPLASYLDVDLVAFGNAEASNETGSWTFECQHGPRECYGNKIQSCVIFAETTSKAIEFVNCASLSHDPSDDVVLEECAGNAGVSWDQIQDCVNNGEADELLAANGVKTKAVTPPIAWVPAIVFDDVFDSTLQDEGEHHFFATVCELLNEAPDVCQTKSA